MPRTMEDAALALPSVKARQVASAMRDLEKRRAAAFGVDSHRTRAAASAPTLDENILVLEPFMEMILQAIQQLQDAACEQATQADVDFATSVVDSLIPPRAASDVATSFGGACERNIMPHGLIQKRVISQWGGEGGGD